MTKNDAKQKKNDNTKITENDQKITYKIYISLSRGP
jgi:hypothetical protein